MPTKLFVVDNVADNPPAGSPFRGTNDANLAGTLSGWAPQGLRQTLGSSLIGQSTSTVTGPTNGIEVGNQPSPQVGVEFVSEPIAAAVTISGTMTFNLWMSESNMSANVGPQVVVERLDNTGAIVSTVVNSEFGVELAVATATANNWTAAPTSTAFNKGDRIRIRIAGNDAGGTMVTGFTFALDLGSPTGGADGDSWVQFNETITFLSADPTGSKLFLTDTASAIGGTGKRDAWTSAGGGSVDSVTNSVTGFQPPIQITDTAGGNVLEWYSHPLTAFTLAGMILFNVRAKVDGLPVNAVSRGEVAICDNAGTLISIWGASGANTPITSTTEAATSTYAAGQDVAITAGQRLRFRIYVDNAQNAMISGHTITHTYSGATPGAAGDAYVILPQTVTESTAVAGPPSLAFM